MKVVIVGNGLAGTMAAKSLREIDPSVGDRDRRRGALPVLSPAQSHRFRGRDPSLREALRFPRQLARAPGHRRSTRIARRPHRPRGRDRRDPGRTPTSAFDRLLLATGSSAVVPPVRGADKKGVFVLRTLDDALSILDALKTRRARRRPGRRTPGARDRPGPQDPGGGGLRE